MATTYGKSEDHMHSKGVQGASWLNVVLGVLILATPFFTMATTTTNLFTAEAGTAPLWSGIIAGIAVIALAGYNAYVGSQRHTERAFTPAMLNVLIGLYVLFSGFMMNTTFAYRWTMAAWGAILVVSAGYNTWAASDARKDTAGRTA